MKKTRTIALALALGLGAAGQVLAHEGHNHGEHEAALTEAAVKTRAADEVTRLVGLKKLAATWKGLAAKSVEKKGTEWLVTFENPKAPDNKILYMFLKSSGEFVAANFTGK